MGRLLEICISKNLNYLDLSIFSAICPFVNVILYSATRSTYSMRIYPNILHLIIFEIISGQ